MPFKWRGLDWITAESYGAINPQKPWAWYDDQCVVVYGDNVMLGARNNPAQIGKLNPMYGIGLMRSIPTFQYGIFELEMKLPQDRYSWPAFWMWGVRDGRYQEIDVLEAFSRPWLHYLRPSLHPLSLWGNVTASALPAVGPRLQSSASKALWPFLRPPRGWHVYTLVWRPSVVTACFDYRPILHDERAFDVPMNIVINNMVTEPPVGATIQTVMHVRNFRYSPL